jgi:beta-xylosidase
MSALAPLFPAAAPSGPSASSVPDPEAAGASVPAGRVAYYNPVFGRVFPDPAVMRVGRTYYAYATTRGDGKRGAFPILRSRDMLHWRPAGNAFRRPPRFSYARWWAPSALRWRGRYYLFYSAHARRPNKMCVAVATAKRPTGPFHHRARLACGGRGGSIDPAPLVVGDQVYLYFARTHGGCNRFPARCSITGVPLRPDLLGPSGPPRRLLNLDQAWERKGAKGTVENPWVLERGGLYYMLYSGGDWQSSYGMGYAVARSPLGPFVKPESRPFLRGRRGLYNPGGGSAITGPRGQLWLAYHARREGAGYANDRRRSLHVDPLEVGDGRVRLQGPSLASAARP